MQLEALGLEDLHAEVVAHVEVELLLGVRHHGHVEVVEDVGVTADQLGVLHDVWVLKEYNAGYHLTI